MSRIPFFFFSLLVAVFFTEGRANEYVLPRDIRPEEFRGLTGKSPFTRSLNMPSSIILTGISSEVEGVTVTLLDSETGESHLVSYLPNFRGWRLKEISKAEDLKSATATILIEGGTTMKVRYDEELIVQGTKRHRERIAQQRRDRSHQAYVHSQRNAPPVDSGTEKLLSAIDRRGLPSGYKPETHQKYVDAKMAAMSDRQKGRVGQLWADKRRSDPNMENRGQSFVRIMEHVAQHEKR